MPKKMLVQMEYKVFAGLREDFEGQFDLSHLVDPTGIQLPKDYKFEVNLMSEGREPVADWMMDFGINLANIMLHDNLQTYHMYKLGIAEVMELSNEEKLSPEAFLCMWFARFKSIQIRLEEIGPDSTCMLVAYIHLHGEDVPLHFIFWVESERDACLSYSYLRKLFPKLKETHPEEVAKMQKREKIYNLQLARERKAAKKEMEALHQESS